MGFGGVVAVTGVGIGVYYGTNSSEEIKKNMESLRSTGSEGKKPDEEKFEEKIESSQKGPLDTEELISSGSSSSSNPE